MLSEIVAFLPKFDTSFMLWYWQNCINCTGNSDSRTFLLVLTTLSKLSHVANSITPDDKLILIDDLKQRILKFDLHPGLIEAICTR